MTRPARPPEIPAGLRRAAFEVLAPLALFAPLPLVWTGGAAYAGRGVR